MVTTSKSLVTTHKCLALAIVTKLTKYHTSTTKQIALAKIGELTNMSFEELKYDFDRVFDLYLNEKLYKAQSLEVKIMLEYLEQMKLALYEREA